MYICSDCGKLKEDVRTVRQYTGCFGSENVYEEWIENCGCGGSLEKAVVCRQCNRFCPRWDTEGGLCYSCRTKAVKEFTDMFSPAQKTYLLEYLQ